MKKDNGGDITVKSTCIEIIRTMNATEITIFIVFFYVFSSSCGFIPPEHFKNRRAHRTKLLSKFVLSLVFSPFIPIKVFKYPLEDG